MKIQTKIKNLTIRPATAQDTPVILLLIKGLAEFERLPHEVVATEKVVLPEALSCPLTFERSFLRRSNMKKATRVVIFFLGIALAGVFAGCLMGPVHSKPGTTTTVILVRHADRVSFEDELTAKGRARAGALVAALSGARVTAIYSPDLKRNLDTVRPLATRVGVDITVKPNLSVLTAREVVDEILSQHAGGVVVMVGNVTGNLQAVYNLLGGTGAGPNEYGDLFILTVPDQGPTKVDKRRFGS